MFALKIFLKKFPFVFIIFERYLNLTRESLDNGKGPLIK